MTWFVLKKLLGLIVTLVVIATLLFALVPAGTAAPELSPVDGYFDWMRRLLVGDLGISPSQNEAVGALIAARLGVTLPLALLALLIAVLLGGGAGALAARRAGSLLDRGLRGLGRIGAAAPEFWIGIVLVLVFSTLLRWLPPGGFVPWSDSSGGALVSLLLPALAIALPQAAGLALATRNAVVPLQGSVLIEGAMARGLTRREAMRRHGMRNALLPVLAVLRRSFPMVLAGTVVVETVFYLPGLGRLLFDAVAMHDAVLARGVLIVLVSVICGILFLIDIGRALADPRLRSWGHP